MATQGWSGVTLTDLRGKAVKVPSKYRNHVVEFQGETFHSKRELRYWLGLQARAKAGEIQHLARQISFPIHGVSPDGGKRYVCEYIADFVYWEQGVRHVVDAKGVRTPTYRLKRKFLAVQGILVEEV